MKTFKKENNGHTLKIVIDDTKLLNALDDSIKEYESLQKKLESLEEDSEEYNELKWDYDMQSVYGDVDCDFCTPEEIIKDLEEFKKIVLDAIAGDGSDLFNRIPLKKNGTFKKTCKPLLKEAVNGTYWEDSYGWNTRVLRLEPINDTTTEMRLDYIVIHY